MTLLLLTNNRTRGAALFRDAAVFCAVHLPNCGRLEKTVLRAKTLLLLKQNEREELQVNTTAEISIIIERDVCPQSK